MMFLPPELRTLVFLTGLTAVCGHAEDTSLEPTHTTALNAPTAEITTKFVTLPEPSAGTNDLAPSSVDSKSELPPESQPTEDVYPCYLADPPDWCEEPPPFWHPEVSATGWDDWGEWNNDNIGGGAGQGFAPTTTVLRPTEQPPVILTTRTPTVVEIRTSVEPSVPDTVDVSGATRVLEPVPTVNRKTQQQVSPAQPTAGQGAPQNGGFGGSSVPQEIQLQPTAKETAPKLTNESEDEASWPKTASSGSNLIDDIIKHLGKHDHGLQPVSAHVPPADASGNIASHAPHASSSTGTARVGGDNPIGNGGGISDGAISTAASITSAHDVIAVGDTITLGVATLTLTPGLYTIIGAGSHTTLVAIQTDDASQWIITMSSSGTAIIATVTDAPATITLPRTGFEASVTNSAGRGVATPRPEVFAISTAGTGMASERTAAAGGITGLVLGMFGLFLAT